MKITSLLFIFFTTSLLTSCSKHFSESSDITPLAQPRNFAQKSGDGKYLTRKIYVPMTSSLLYHWDYDYFVLEREDHLARGLGSLFEGLRAGFYTVGMNVFSMNTGGVRTNYDFDYLDPDYIKDIRIKNVFFHLEPCDEKLKTCQKREDRNSLNFNFIKELFLNFSANYTAFTKIDVGEIEMKKGEYDKKSKMAFRPLFKSLQNDINSGKRYQISQFKDVTIARYRRGHTKNKVDDILIFKVQDDMLSDIRSYIKGSKDLRSYVKLQEVIGNNIYIQVKDSSKRDEFAAMFKFHIKNAFGEDVIKSNFNCSPKHCINFDVNDVNLMPLMKQSTHLNIDTFYSLNKVEKSDFEYRGLLELEIKVEIP